MTREKKTKLLKYFPQSCAGFSLIELSVVLVIMGTLMGLGLPLLTAWMSVYKTKQTHAHQTQVVTALAAYVLQTAKLPSPADPAAPPHEQGIACSNLTQGIIPYRTLGIREELAKDGFKQWMTYAPSSHLLDRALQGPPGNYKNKKRKEPKPLFLMEDDEKGQEQEQKLDSFFERFCKGSLSKDEGFTLKLTTETGQSVLDKREDSNDFIAFVLVSHGPEGSGAYRVNGTRDRFPVVNPLLEGENADDTLAFVTRPLVFQGENYFSHQLMWETKYNFMAIHAQRPCGPYEDLK